MDEYDDSLHEEEFFVFCNLDKFIKLFQVEREWFLA